MGNIINHYTGASGDIDALAFITAAGLTDSTQISAINTLVADLKTNGLWDKMKAIYPFVGGTAFSHKWNLKDPRDLDAAFRLVFVGGLTHSSTGILPNGTTGYAKPFLTPSSVLSLNSLSLSYYSRTINTTVGARELMASFVGAAQEIQFYYNETLAGRIIFDSYQGGTSGGRVFGTATNTQGLLVASRISNISSKIYRNNTIINSIITNSGAQPTIPFYLFCANVNNTASLFSNLECSFAHIGDGITDSDESNLYTLVQAYQTTLGRQV